VTILKSDKTHLDANGSGYLHRTHRTHKKVKKKLPIKYLKYRREQGKYI